MSTQSNGRQLLTACFYGDFPGVRRSVSGGANVDFKGQFGQTPAHYCCWNDGHPEILQYLLEQDANADLADNDRWAPLHFSAVHNKQECVTVLLAHGVAVDAINGAGSTALWLASLKGYLPIVQLLVQGGADFERAGNSGRTPIDVAREEGRAEVVRYLEAESKWRRRRAWAMVFCSIKNVDSDAKMMRVLQNRDLAGVIASYL
jgi:ankyrin repeat protein